MRILAIDAATEACSVALLQGHELIERTAEPGKTYSQQILALVQEVLQESGITLCSLDGLAATIGPGGFTGVRITVAVAQGLAFGANLPTVGITTLEALALQGAGREGGHVLACLDARMNEVYWGGYWVGPSGEVQTTMPPRVAAPSALLLPDGQAYAGVGRGFRAHPQLAQTPNLQLSPENANALPRARDVARLASLRLQAGQGSDPAELQPLYLRDKVALTEAERLRS